MRPYIDHESTNEYVIREFDQNIDLTELKWHRDAEQRIVEVLQCGPGWKFQYDNETPWDLEPQMSFVILKHTWHRVIKGKENLIVKIHKIKD